MPWALFGVLCLAELASIAIQVKLILMMRGLYLETKAENEARGIF